MADDSTTRSARGLYGISVTSELSGIAPQTLRLYEHRGLLATSRTDGGPAATATRTSNASYSASPNWSTKASIWAGIAQILDLETKTAAAIDYTQLELRHAKREVSRQPDGPERQKGGVPIMTDIDHRVVPDDASEADAIDQRLVVDADDDTGLDSSQLDALRDRDVNEADIIDQATVVPAPMGRD